MSSGLTALEWLCSVPVAAGSLFWLLSLGTLARFRRRPIAPLPAEWPPVTLIKLVCGLEKNLRDTLRSACLQNYPVYQVIFSVRSPEDPALPLLEEIQAEFGAERVTLAVENLHLGPNGKVNNLAGALPHARYEVLVLSDSDVLLPPDYLRAMVAPLLDPGVGYVSSLYRAASAETLAERWMLLTLNADFLPSVVFAYETGASHFCLGASVAVRRTTLERIGGPAALADYLVEDYEMGRRIVALGLGHVLAPCVVDTVLDLPSMGAWWRQQVQWDQKTRAARPWAFFATVVIRSVPFAVLLVVLRRADPVSAVMLAMALIVRWSVAAAWLQWGLRDREGLRALLWLPLRDVAALGSWAAALLRRKTVWRGEEFLLKRGGRLHGVRTRRQSGCDAAADPHGG
ncbi:MAG: bacteriohopanetetrol glucosamine biosynthesis glycosyltransferase HpnI [Bryobacterales bacterium]|nr:bacteriohopanetetrol glucosamine biosynthesis glycosyltransferase HpnI [Bryobacteraceae bacterium]MDW8355824.1 bacteriohopanetetrol glucosamine biosynthesis glycosyltransferase HpnI [Bryobacterales bacterium]